MARSQPTRETMKKDDPPEPSPGFQKEALIEGLPDEVALSVLARLPCIFYPRLRSVCRTWNEAFKPYGSVVSYRRKLGLLEPWPLVRLLPDNGSCRWITIDPHLYLPHRLPSFAGTHIKDVADSEVGAFATHSFHLCIQPHMYCFDAPNMRWYHSPMPALDSRRGSTFASAIMDDYWYVMGGDAKDPRSVERIHLRNLKTLSSWERVPDMHCGRKYARAISRQGCLYVLGGRKESYDERTQIYSGEIWDPRREEWTLVPQLWPIEVFRDYSFYEIIIGVVMGTLFALKKCTRELVCYRDDDREWVTLGRVPLPRGDRCRKLLGVGSELWLFYYGGEKSTSIRVGYGVPEVFLFDICICDVAFLSNNVPKSLPKLSWWRLEFESKGKLDFFENSVAYI